MIARVVRSMLIVVLLAAAFYLSFELGRLQAGFSLLDTRRQTDAFQTALAERDSAIGELERQVAILEVELEVERETYARIEENLAELQVSRRLLLNALTRNAV